MLRRPRRANPVPQGFTVPGGVAGVCSRLIETDAPTRSKACHWAGVEVLIFSI